MLSRILNAGRGVLARLLEFAGLEGVISVSLLISIVLMFYWGYRVAWAISMAKTILSATVRHGLVSMVILLSVGGGALYLGVIPGINLDPLLRLLPEVLP